MVSQSTIAEAKAGGGELTRKRQRRNAIRPNGDVYRLLSEMSTHHSLERVRISMQSEGDDESEEEAETSEEVINTSTRN